MIPELRHLSYGDILAALKLTTLQARRLRCDLIQQYKITHGFDKVNWTYSQQAPSISICVPAGAIRGHSYRLEQELIKDCDKIKFFFMNRIAAVWNSLPLSIVEASTIK
jgi:hypothetical protein